MQCMYDLHSNSKLNQTGVTGSTTDICTVDYDHSKEAWSTIVPVPALWSRIPTDRSYNYSFLFHCSWYRTRIDLAFGLTLTV